MMTSIVYFLELCQISSRRSQHDDVSRRATVKLDTMQHASGGETPCWICTCRAEIVLMIFDIIRGNKQLRSSQKRVQQWRLVTVVLPSPASSTADSNRHTPPLPAYTMPQSFRLLGEPQALEGTERFRSGHGKLSDNLASACDKHRNLQHII